MAVLWFAREALHSTTGFAAYQLPIQTIVAKLGGERNFQFLSRLDRPPITCLGRSGQAVDYRLVVLELDDTEALTANWRTGFYKVAFSPVEVVEKLGEPNAALEAEQDISATRGQKRTIVKQTRTTSRDVCIRK
jgi:hypothetical protein